MLSLEDQVRAHLDAARGLSDAALKIATGSTDEITTTEAVVAVVAMTKALIDVSVDMARALDQLAAHTEFTAPTA